MQAWKSIYCMHHGCWRFILRILVIQAFYFCSDILKFVWSSQICRGFHNGLVDYKRSHTQHAGRYAQALVDFGLLGSQATLQGDWLVNLISQPSQALMVYLDGLACKTWESRLYLNPLYQYVLHQSLLLSTKRKIIHWNNLSVWSTPIQSKHPPIVEQTLWLCKTRLDVITLSVSQPYSPCP